MSMSVEVVLHPSIVLPDGRSIAGKFRTWVFGAPDNRYRIDGEGRLWEEWVLTPGEIPEEDCTRMPLHGFLTFEVADVGQHRYTARFTYGVLDGIMVGEENVWNARHVQPNEDRPQQSAGTGLR
jgi:hypothetical protein